MDYFSFFFRSATLAAQHFVCAASHQQDYTLNSASHSKQHHSACNHHTLPHAHEPFDLTRMAVAWGSTPHALGRPRPVSRTQQTDRQTDKTDRRQAKDEKPGAALSVRLGKGVSCPEAHRAYALSQNGYGGHQPPGGFRCYIRCCFGLLLLPFRWC